MSSRVSPRLLSNEQGVLRTGSVLIRKPDGEEQLSTSDGGC